MSIVSPRSDADFTPTTTSEAVTLILRGPNRTAELVRVQNDQFLIGRGDFCDLQLADTSVPLALAELHLQAGNVWIEATDSATPLILNGKPLMRLALRDGDVWMVGGYEITFRLGAVSEAELTRELAWGTASEEDLSRLTPTELCDRILAEQATVDDFERRQLDGWRTLMSAVKSTAETSELATAPASLIRFEAAMGELAALSELLCERTRILAEQETVLRDSAAELREAQRSLSDKLDQLLQRFQTNELRASA